jgi:peptidyl-prolyl cis-trans isomerase SurA
MQKMKKFSPLSFLFFYFLTTLVFSQDSSVLMKINDKEIGIQEFENLYTKNLELVQDPAQKDIDNYKQLFINFKLELEDAYRNKYDTAQAFKKELKQYRKELAKKYLSDEETINQLTKEAYERMKQDVKVSHILIKVPENASPKDSLKAYNQINNIYKKAINGADFNMLAKKYSQDPSARTNAGNLGYINVFHTVYPFETAAYNTPVGKISKPFRTKFGYHIVKVEDKRKARGEIEVAHIFIREQKKDSSYAQKQIQKIYQKAIKKEDSFENLAKKYSEDKSSAKFGGKIRRFGIREMIPEFEDQAFALNKPGEISKPFKSRYGWHIIKLLHKYPLPEYSQIENDLRAKVSRDNRAKIGQEKLYKKISEIYPIKEITPLSSIAKQIDERFFENKWQIPQGKFNQKLFVINEDQTFTVDDFYKFLYKNQLKNPKEVKNKNLVLKKLYDKFKRQKLMDYYNAHLEQLYPDFARIMKEYKEGLLLFNIKSDMVWNKAVQDTTGLKRYYNQHKEEYRVPVRYIILSGQTTSKKEAKKVQKAFMKGETMKNIKEKFAHKDVIFDKKELSGEQLGDKLPQLKAKKTVKYKEGNEYLILYLAGTKESYIPELNTIKGKVINDYQKYLENQWLEKLQSEIPVEINEKNWLKLREKYKK